MKKKPDPYLRCMPWKAAMVFGPIERILHRLETDGTVDAAGRQIVFYEDGNGGWYDMIAALRGVIEFHQLAAARYRIPASVESMVKFANKLDAGSPIFIEDIAAVRRDIDSCTRQAMSLRLSQAQDVLQTVRISMAMDKIKEAA